MTTTLSNSIEVLFEDAHLLIADKPAGLFVHPSPMDPKVTDTLISRLGSGLKPVNRLDRPTSGPVVLAKSGEAVRRMQAQWHQPTTNKYYEAIVRGWMPEAVELDYPLRYERDGSEQSRLQAPLQCAQTSFTPLAHWCLPIAVGKFPQARYSVVRCQLHTGRKHQIRRHLKHLLHPIVGDTRYGEGRHNRLFRQHFDWQRLALRCCELSFTHPFTEQSVLLTPDRPPAWQQLFMAMASYGGACTTL